MPTEVHGAAEFRQLLTDAKRKLIVVDFYAKWCGPCRAIEPHVNELAAKYVHVLFLKVDIDENPDVAEAHGVTSVPTFFFFKNFATVDSYRGSNKNALEDKLKRHCEADEAEAAEASSSSGASASGGGAAAEVAGAGAGSALKGQVDLASLIEKSGTECLNQSAEHRLEHALAAGGGYLESECDEQLIITVAFNQLVRLHSLKIAAPRDKAPKTVKLFVNLPYSLDFDSAERAEAVQTLELGPDDVAGESVVSLKLVKFQSILKLTLFIKDNQGGGEVTQIDHLAFFGSTMNATNMAEFKRVAGKKGESH